MIDNLINETVNTNAFPASTPPDTGDYAVTLKYYGLQYKRTDYYLEVGEPSWVQGWILDISVVQSQLLALQEIIIPILIEESVPFKIARSIRKAHSIISAEYGWFLLGKVISIFPQDPPSACRLARKLVQMTAGFRGPDIPTDRKLGGVVFARYGAGKPVLVVDKSGTKQECIYDSQGNLNLYVQTIPFQIPPGIAWPFKEIATPKEPKLDTVLQDRYKPIYMLKNDPKGTVRKGLWLKKLYHIKWCVIKEGRQNMCSDMEGRDIVDRLRWQRELHDDLADNVALPAIYDLFEENGNGYLVMEYISGPSFNKWLEAAYKSNSWETLSLAVRIHLLGYIRQILDIIMIMHEKGYIHRDITTNNFLINKKDQLYMIDMELTYSRQKNKPSPPFRLGTQGYMSPEQGACLEPTIEQDIYAIGAVLLESLTGLSAFGFAQNDISIVKDQLRFHIKDTQLATLIGDCFNIDPALRPTLPMIKETTESFAKKQIHLRAQEAPATIGPAIDLPTLKQFIIKAIKGLLTPGMINGKGLWVSKSPDVDASIFIDTKPEAVTANLAGGVAGVVWLLAKANHSGFDITSCNDSYEKGLAYIRQYPYNRSEEVPGGIFFGTSGAAMALLEHSVSSESKKKEELTAEILSLLSNKFLQGSGIANGLAGQGMALLHATRLLGQAVIKPLLLENVEQLIQKQQPDGSWLENTGHHKRPIKPTGFGHGAAGIVCFLLNYLQLFKEDSTIRQAALKGINWLISQANKKRGVVSWALYKGSRNTSMGFENGSLGVVLTLIKAYEIFSIDSFRKLAEDCLRSYPVNKLRRNLSLGGGLAGYGEVCLEAARIFGNSEWQAHANWVVQYLLHYHKKENEEAYYWQADDSAYPTAELLLGSSGIIHFLLRYYLPDKHSHPMLCY